MDLGFAEKRDSCWLRNLYFPSKIGGMPAWLELNALPKTETLLCGNCKNPKIFLCQIYAPAAEAHSFHRTIYVFVCRNAQCQQANNASNLLVLRSQLPRVNNFYSAEPPVDDNEDAEPLPAIIGSSKLCQTCGCAASLACARCKAVNYCCAQHQRLHWPAHKIICAKETPSKTNAIASFPTPLFAEYEIVIEAHDDTAATECAAVTESKQQMQEYEKLVATGQTGTLSQLPIDELDKYASSSEDKQFEHFKQQISAEPEQIIRYKGQQPLWIADVAQTVQAQVSKVPNCANCGGVRQFEFQIMPQMLHLLQEEQLDWGVLVVYTCAQSCKPPADVGYLPEYIVKQDIVK